jgi:hypothetical protein
MMRWAIMRGAVVLCFSASAKKCVAISRETAPLSANVLTTQKP